MAYLLARCCTASQLGLVCGASKVVLMKLRDKGIYEKSTNPSEQSYEDFDKT